MLMMKVLLLMMTMMMLCFFYVLVLKKSQLPICLWIGLLNYYYLLLLFSLKTKQKTPSFYKQFDITPF